MVSMLKAKVCAGYNGDLNRIDVHNSGAEYAEFDLRRSRVDYWMLARSGCSEYDTDIARGYGLSLFWRPGRAYYGVVVP